MSDPERNTIEREVVKPPWRLPTRRAFVAMLGLGAAALVVRAKRVREPKRSTWSGTTRWIGHC